MQFLLQSAGLRKNYLVDFCKTWMEETSWPRIDPSNFLVWIQMKEKDPGIFNSNDCDFGRFSTFLFISQGIIAGA